MTRDPAEELALWRYHLIAEALSPRLGGKERGLVVRRLAGEEHVGPDGQPRRLSRNTLDRWIRAYREHGLSGLRDRPRSDQGSVRRHPELIQEAVRLRLDQPARSAAHIAEMLSVHRGVQLSERIVREQLQKRGLTRAELLGDQRTWGRYEASEPNAGWIADVLLGPFVPFPKAPGSEGSRLFLTVDDHSRLLVHGRWCAFEKLRSGQEVLHQAGAIPAWTPRRGPQCRPGSSSTRSPARRSRGSVGLGVLDGVVERVLVLAEGQVDAASAPSVTAHLNQAHLRVGDSFTRTAEGRPLRLHMVREVFSVDNLGISLWTGLDTYTPVRSDVLPATYFVTLTPGSDVSAYVRRVPAAQPDFIDAQPTDTSTIGPVKIVDSALLVIAAVLCLIGIVGVLNTLLLNTRKRIPRHGSSEGGRP